MPDIQSRAARIATFKRGVASVPESTLDPAAVDKKGSTMNVLAAGTSAVADEVEARAMAKLAVLTLDGAEGAELDAVASERTYGDVSRVGATQSVVELQFARPTTGGGGGTVSAGTQFPAGAVTFTLDADVNFGASTLSAAGTATSSTAGSGTRIAGGVIRRAAAPLFDATITVAQTAASSGGDDVETDLSLRARVRAWPGSVRCATFAALEACARRAGARQAVAVEVVDSLGVATGLVILYVADGNGQANAALVRKVTVALRDAKAAGQVVRVVGSVPSFVSLELSIGYRDGFDTEAVQALVRAAVVAAVNALAPNEVLQVSLLLAAIRSVPGTVVPSGAVVAPAGDVYPGAGGSLRTTADRVTFI